MFRHVLLALTLIPLAVCVAAAEDEAPMFRAGAATSNITPPLGQPIVGGWTPAPATYIHDELHARCLVLDDGRTRLVIVICDNVGIPREVFDAAKALVEQETEIPASCQLMAATHTHSASSARNPNKVVADTDFSEYQRFLIRRIADGVRVALHHLEPARIAWGRAEEPTQVFNRRWYVNDPQLLQNPFGGTDKVRMNPPRGSASLLRPSGPVDPEVSFVSVQSRTGRPIALLANYSLHYVGGVPGGHISADYFGAFANRIAELLQAEKQQPPFVGIMSNGTSGDINNIDFQEKNPPRSEPYEKIHLVANLVADKVYEAHQSLTFQEHVDLSAAYHELKLAVRMPTEEQLARAKVLLADKDESINTVHSRERIYAERLMGLSQSSGHVDVPLQVLRIGDLAITSIPFEVFVETGLELKEKSPFAHTFTIELANGSFGYLPTPEHHELGGYETWLGTSNVEIEASDKITHQLLNMLQQLHSERP